MATWTSVGIARDGYSVTLQERLTGHRRTDSQPDPCRSLGILLAATGILFAPVIHRVLHRFHVEDSAER